MTQMNDYAPITLLPSQQTSLSSAAFVAPPFEMAFRRCEKLFWEGYQLDKEVSKLQYIEVGAQSCLEMAIYFLENRLRLQMTSTELAVAIELLEKEVETVGRRFDARYTQCSDANCMEGWLIDGAKINVMKACTLQDKAKSLQSKIQSLLAGTAQAACEVREVVAREFGKATSGQKVSLILGLPNLAL